MNISHTVQPSRRASALLRMWRACDRFTSLWPHPEVRSLEGKVSPKVALPKTKKQNPGAKARVFRVNRKLKALPATNQTFRMPQNMIPAEGRHEEIGMVITRLHPEGGRCTGLRERTSQRLRL